MAKQIKGSRKAPQPSLRAMRYGKLVRGWDWRTKQELLDAAEKARTKMKLTKTEFLELALRELIERA